jgi:hypothetical protein
MSGMQSKGAEVTSMRRFGLVVLAALAFNACTPEFLTQNNSQVLMRILKVSSEAGEESEEGDFLLSDVDPVFNDNAVITVEVLAKNAALPDPGRFNDVMVERFEVRYFRTDGRNQEGVDVPFRITGPLGTLIPVNTEGDVAFVIVRHQAKEEPPLRNLRFVSNTGNGGGLGILTVVAEITLHGRTTRGEGVTASARLQITFADFADENSPTVTTVPTSTTPTTTTLAGRPSGF